MAQTVFIKGDLIENATSYDLLEKTTEGTYNALATDTQINFEVSALGLEEGDHTLVVQAKAEGYEASDYSNEVIYTVAGLPIVNLYNATSYPVQNGYYGNSLPLPYSDKSILEFSNYRVTKTVGLDVEKFPVEGGKTYSIKLYNAPTKAMADGSTGTTELGQTEIPYYGIWGIFFYETINGKPSIRYMYTICNNTAHIAYWNTSRPAGYTGALPYTETNDTSAFKIVQGTNDDKIVVTNLTSGAKSSDSTTCVFGGDSKYTQSCQVEIKDPAITHMTVLFGNPKNVIYQMKSNAGLLVDEVGAIETIKNGLMIVEGKKLPDSYIAYEG